ncbi:DUF3072 domain-containing protein [Pseudokineococcus basanitobsidens]|uniref:DUF3072 domain-containing protein n=1 Tax=Pseudokineococcus basanitobsidens TaxID=1926649 RepID=A0ABU8RJ50_9ACTN
MSEDTSEHPPAQDPETGEAATDDRGAHGDGRPADQEPGTATSDAEKDPESWVTGGEPATGPQRSYLSTLAQEAGEQLPDDLSKAKASEEIDRLQGKTGRGQGS